MSSTLRASGFNVVDLGLATTPTVELAVSHFEAQGGIVITASHNPVEWNALKLLDQNGEFISQEEGERLIAAVGKGDYAYVPVGQLGSLDHRDFLREHIEAILALPAVKANSIRQRRYTVVLDAVNSVGGFATPELLIALGVEQVHTVNCDVTGRFAHNPEPLPEHLTALREEVVKRNADLGIAVDPDVDRMSLVSEDGVMFGEEYGLVAVADYVLSETPGNTVSNLSSTRALRKVTEARGGEYFAAAVGEVHVVRKMKEVHAVIGGEGNGGVIYPALHYGRDALVGVALFLSALAQSGEPVSRLRSRYPRDVIVKRKIEVRDPSAVIAQVKNAFNGQPMDETDGIRISFGEDWVHVRQSNTEPIVRVYAESDTADKAQALAQSVLDVIG